MNVEVNDVELLVETLREHISVRESYSKEFENKPMFAIKTNVIKSLVESIVSWPGDKDHENGSYVCVCCNCGVGFTGHKRRVMCRVCDK